MSGKGSTLARPLSVALIASLLGFALAGCTADTDDRRGASAGERATLLVSAPIPGGAKGAYIDERVQAVEARVYPFPYSSWDAFWEAAEGGYYFDDYYFDDDYYYDEEDPEAVLMASTGGDSGDGDTGDGDGDGDSDSDGDSDGGSEAADAWATLMEWDWNETEYTAGAVLTDDQHAAEIDVAPGAYLVVAGAWDDAERSGDPLAVSAVVMDLEAGQHVVALNLVAATWDVEDGPLRFGLLTQTYNDDGVLGDDGFDWGPALEGVTPPAGVIGLPDGELAGVHIGFFDGLYEEMGYYYPYYGPYLDHDVLFRLPGGEDGDEAVLEPGWRIADGGDVDYLVDVFVGHRGALFQDYGAERGNRAEMLLPEAFVDTWKYSQESAYGYGAVREAGFFAVGRPFMQPDLEPSYEEEWQFRYTDLICVADGAGDGEECAEREVIELDGWAMEDDFPDEFASGGLSRGAVRNGVEIDATFLEWQDKEWLEWDRTVDGEVPVIETAAASGRGVSWEEKREAIVRALLRERLTGGGGAEAAGEGNCFDVGILDREYRVDYVLDGDEWLSGTLLWSTAEIEEHCEAQDEWAPCFVPGLYRNLLTGALEEEFTTIERSGEIRACAHDVTLTARGLDFEFGTVEPESAATGGSAPLPLRGAVAGGEAVLHWDAAAHPGAVFNVCRAREEITAAGFANCAALDGGVLETGVTAPHRVPADGARHWIQLEAANDTGSAYSPVAVVTRRGVYPAPITGE